MKKQLCFILSTLLIISSSFIACKEKESDTGKISLIVSNAYGSIKPVDIYEIKDGYMTTLGEVEYRKKYELLSKYAYCAYRYSASKSTELYELHLLSINYATLKVTYKYITPTTITIKPTEPYTVYYSEYWGKKEEVLFIENISFHKTIHIELEERNDTYKITYYRDGSIDTPIGIDSIKGLDNYKKVVEVPKSDISKIEYIV